MAHIYKAARLGSSGFFKLLAVKRIKEKGAQDAGFQDMFIKEAHVQASFAHPNVVNIFDFGQEKGHYFIAMEYLNGVPLRTLLEMLRFRHERLQPELVLYIIDSLLKGLDYIHNMVAPDGASMTIIHRDIDPQNVFLTFSGEVKLIDFGIADAEVDIEHKDDAALKGKYSYFAPELLDGHQADQRSDLFSAGLLFYEMLTLHKFFAAETGEQVLNAVCSLDIDKKISDLSVDDDLKKILSRALARNPEQRYPTVSEFSDDLSYYQHERKIRVASSGFSALMDHLFQKEQQEELKKNQFYFSILKDRDTADNDHTAIIKPADLQREIQGTPEPVADVGESMAAAPDVTGEQAAVKENIRLFIVKNKKPVALFIAACCVVLVVALLLPKNKVIEEAAPIVTESGVAPVQPEDVVNNNEAGLIGSIGVEVLEDYDNDTEHQQDAPEQDVVSVSSDSVGNVADKPSSKVAQPAEVGTEVSEEQSRMARKGVDNDSSIELAAEPVIETVEEKVEDTVPEQEVIQARIEIQGKPEGQIVFLDGVELGELPISIQARPGFHSVECRKDGFWPHTVRVRALGEQSVTVECNLLSDNGAGKKKVAQPVKESAQ